MIKDLFRIKMKMSSQEPGFGDGCCLFSIRHIVGSSCNQDDSVGTGYTIVVGPPLIGNIPGGRLGLKMFDSKTVRSIICTSPVGIPGSDVPIDPVRPGGAPPA